jgi:hypothetical protein
VRIQVAALTRDGLNPVPGRIDSMVVFETTTDEVMRIVRAAIEISAFVPSTSINELLATNRELRRKAQDFQEMVCCLCHKPVSDHLWGWGYRGPGPLDGIMCRTPEVEAKAANFFRNVPEPDPEPPDPEDSMENCLDCGVPIASTEPYAPYCSAEHQAAAETS